MTKTSTFRGARDTASTSSSGGARQTHDGTELACQTGMNACARSPRDGELPIADVLRRLACYWRVNPLASDTTEGILQWWLGLAPSNANLVERALAMLEAAGIVESVRTPGTQLHYRRVSADAASNERLDGIIAASGSEPHPG